MSITLQTLSWYSALVCLMTFSFIANAKLFLRIITAAFFPACAFALLTHK
jgi:hypothetical protein